MTCGLSSSNTRESILVQVGDHALLVVDDRGMQQDLLHFGMENKNPRVRYQTGPGVFCLGREAVCSD